tara:strand:- start:5013 stop:5312 length:300 start_codon:yes stop_codon:yes gene_type:complete
MIASVDKGLYVIQFCRELIRDPQKFSANGIVFEHVKHDNYEEHLEKIRQECCMGVLEFVERRVPLALDSTRINLFHAIRTYLPNSIVDVNKKQLLDRMR